MKSNSDDTDGCPSITRFSSGMRIELIDANASSSVTVIVTESSSCIIRLSTLNSFASKGTRQRAESRRKKKTSAFCPLPSAFRPLRSDLPADMDPLADRPMHPLQLFLFLLLHGTEQRFDVRIALLLSIGSLLRLLRLRLRRRSFLLLMRAALLPLLLRLANEGDLEIALRSRIRWRESQCLGEIANGGVVRVRRQRAAAAIE